jgi:hypothetical protein
MNNLAAAQAKTEPHVQHFRQIVLWPLQLIAPDWRRGDGFHTMLGASETSPWRLVDDEFGPDGALEERHYREFVSFLPHVQRFLYGDAKPGVEPKPADMPVRVYRRTDIARVLITLEDRAAPILCDVAHADLYFFHDVDAVILACEIWANDLPLKTAQALMHRFGRAYPAGWSEGGAPVHCPMRVEWLNAAGAVLTASDYGDKSRYLGFVGKTRTPRISTHWEYLLQPIVCGAAEDAGKLRFREIEYYRMPVMAYLSLDTLDRLEKEDFIHLALATEEKPFQRPYSDRFIREFDDHHAYDRFYADGMDSHGGAMRFLTSGEALCIISGDGSTHVNCNERGLLGQFRHQYFLLFMIAHFHKAALLMLSDRMVAAIKRFNPADEKSVRGFRNETFGLQESYLRFSQRYLFTEISGQPHLRDMFRMLRRHLAVDKLHKEVRGEIIDMVQYLDSNALRRQSSSIYRLTVVTIAGLVGTIVTGFLGMNLIAAADDPLSLKLWYFAAVTAAVLALTGLTVVFSGGLARLLDQAAGDDRPDRG